MRWWALYVGERGPRRTERLVEVIATLSGAGRRVAGFLQGSVVEGEARRARTEVVRLGTDDRLTVARAASTPRGPHEEAFCSMVFDHDAFAAARSWLLADGARADVLVIDEIGKLEVAGRGHHDAVVEALRGPIPVVLSIRGELLFEALSRFELGEPSGSLEPGEPPSRLVDALLRTRGARR